MIEKTNTLIEGFFKVTHYDKQGLVIKETDWQHNEIIANAPIILARLLGGQPWNIDTIAVMKAGTIIATAPITTVTYPSFEEVQVNALFDEVSFNDTIDELQLISSIGGTFSKVIDLSFEKNSEQTMGIQWKLKLTFCDGLWIPLEGEATFGLGADPYVIFPGDRIDNRVGPPARNYLLP
jgi:hypothetical protein